MKTRWTVESLNIMGGHDTVAVTRFAWKARALAWLLNQANRCGRNGCSGCAWPAPSTADDIQHAPPRR